MNSDDPLASALEAARAERRARESMAAQQRAEAERAATNAASEAAKGRQRLRPVGRSFVERARAARIPLEQVSVPVSRKAGLFGQKTKWRNERRRAWVLRSFSRGDSYSVGHSGIYVLEDGRIVTHLATDTEWEYSDELVKQLAAFLANHGA